MPQISCYMVAYGETTEAEEYWILGQFSLAKKTAQKGYKEFVAEGMEGDSPWEAVVGQIFLGGEGFVEKLESLLVDRKEIAEIPKTQRHASSPDYRHFCRRVGIEQARMSSS